MLYVVVNKNASNSEARYVRNSVHLKQLYVQHSQSARIVMLETSTKICSMLTEVQLGSVGVYIISTVVPCQLRDGDVLRRGGDLQCCWNTVR